MIDASLVAAKQAELQVQLAEWAADNSALVAGQTLIVTVNLEVVESTPVIVRIEGADGDSFRRTTTSYFTRQLLTAELDEVRCACAKTIMAPLVSDILANGNQGVAGSAVVAIVLSLGKRRDASHIWNAYYDGIVRVNQILTVRHKPFRLTWNTSGNKKEGPFRFYRINPEA